MHSRSHHQRHPLPSFKLAAPPSPPPQPPFKLKKLLRDSNCFRLTTFFRWIFDLLTHLGVPCASASHSRVRPLPLHLAARLCSSLAIPIAPRKLASLRPESLAMYNNEAAEDFCLQLGDSTSGLSCMSPGMPNSFPGPSRGDVGMMMCTDLWGANESDDPGDDELPPHSSQSHLLSGNQGHEQDLFVPSSPWKDASHSGMSWKDTSLGSWKSSSYQDVLSGHKSGHNHEVCPPSTWNRGTCTSARTRDMHACTTFEVICVHCC